MISFWASVVITVATILIGYVNDSLPVQYNEADWLCKSFLRGLGRRRMRWRDTRPVMIPAPLVTTNAFEDFIFAFSDQQLVTGLAMLVAIFFKGDISIYSFQVAVSVAWFSSTIHLSTLVVLRRYAISD